MPIGPKTRNYLALRGNPARSILMEQMRANEIAFDMQARMAIEKAVSILEKEWEKYVADKKGEAKQKLDEMYPQLFAEFEKQVRSKIDSLPHLKGDKGDNIKGDKGDQGDAGYTPTADVDYPSIESIRKMAEEILSSSVKILSEKSMTKEAIMKAMEEMIPKILDPEKIARALETLHNAERLDYEALKNRPGIPVEGPQKHTLHRGGPGKQTYYYDLSDLCNGVDKTFAIPANTRVVAVSGTDAPGGIYRPLVDWTGSGTLLLTLTAEVAAPTAGATLYILYVQ